MRIRFLLFAAAVAVGATACSSTTAPMECEGNPKCKADLQPVVPPLKFEPGVAAPTPSPLRALPARLR